MDERTPAERSAGSSRASDPVPGRGVGSRDAPKVQHTLRLIEIGINRLPRRQVTLAIGCGSFGHRHLADRPTRAGGLRAAGVHHVPLGACPECRASHGGEKDRTPGWPAAGRRRTRWVGRAEREQTTQRSGNGAETPEHPSSRVAMPLRPGTRDEDYIAACGPSRNPSGLRASERSEPWTPGPDCVLIHEVAVCGSTRLRPDESFIRGRSEPMRTFVGVVAGTTLALPVLPHARQSRSARAGGPSASGHRRTARRRRLDGPRAARRSHPARAPPRASRCRSPRRSVSATTTRRCTSARGSSPTLRRPSLRGIVSGPPPCAQRVMFLHATRSSAGERPVQRRYEGCGDRRPVRVARYGRHRVVYRVEKHESHRARSRPGIMAGPKQHQPVVKYSRLFNLTG